MADTPAKPKQTAILRLVTPKQAAAELDERNNMNRTINAEQVAALARQLINGEWLANGQTITYDTDSEIVDGQHRYAAIVKANTPAWCWIIGGLDPAVRPTIDDNRKRTLRDDLAMNGIKGGAAIEALLRKIARWQEYGGLAAKPRGRKVFRLDLTKQYREMHAEVTHAISAAHEYPRVPLTPANKAFVWWLLRQYADDDLIGQFYSILSIGSQFSKDDVIVTLRDKLRSDRATIKNQNQVLTEDHVWYTIRTWNAWLSGQPLERLVRPRGGVSNPYPVPYRAGK